MITVDALNYWEVEETADRLVELPEDSQREILRQVSIIWPVSHSLCFAFLDQAANALTCLHSSQLSEWVNSVLDLYEQEGLRQARQYMADVENNFLCRIRGETGLAFNEAVGRLLPYIQGLSRRKLRLLPASEVYTDTESIFLPPEISIFKEKAKNFLTYKLITSFQWGLIAVGTFDFHPGAYLIERLSTRYGRTWQKEEPNLTAYLNLFPEPHLAGDLFLLVESLRASAFLREELPGLMRDAQPVFDRLHQQRPDLGALEGKALLVEALHQWFLTGRTKGKRPPKIQELYKQAVRLMSSTLVPAAPAETIAGAVLQLYELLEHVPAPYEEIKPVLMNGRLKPAAVQAARQEKREKARQQFIQALAALVPPEAAGQTGQSEEKTEGTPAELATEEGVAILPLGGHRDRSETRVPHQEERPPEYVVIGGQEIKVPETLRPLVQEIREDFGHIPDRYISAAIQQAGRTPVRGPGPEPEEGEPATGPLTYDEWDFRRAGFRKNWCVLREKELSPVKGTFVDHTLRKYRGQLQQLRRQFEMMRLQQRYIKRQKEGDEIDFDAVTEALGDARAGLSPSEKLFVRLSRDERNIAAVFLVDMSSSTEGWVSKALKESLVLLCEALEVLGDRYAIYGFSGMRRLRSELYHVKHLAERYAEEVRGRIAAITPKEYTRMGPPIRHVTEMLKATDAKVRLLITLSDGKPEDYDDYKGDYAIEDTRHALIEAKAAGIHPFCITIDQESHDYISHMYGEVNYIFIDEVKKLPLRMPEIYRMLTT